jgi:hypothetical protein
MMKTFSELHVGAWTLAALACGCGLETMDVPPHELQTNQPALVCSNDQATFAILATMAKAAANDMRRWLPELDMQWNYTTWKLELSETGKARCPFNSSGVKECKEMNSLLSLQDDAAQGLQFGGQPLDVGVLRNRLFSYWGRQKTCLDRPDNGSGDDCPAERHDLVFSHSVVSNTTCVGGRDYWYHAYYGDTITNLTPADAAQLKNQLIWAGGTDNPFLAFEQVDGNVKVDPIDGTTGGGGSQSPICTVASGYNPATGNCDATDVPQTHGSCCTCNSQHWTWQPSFFAGYWVCKP